MASLGFKFHNKKIRRINKDGQKFYFGYYKIGEDTYATPLLASENEVEQWARENAITLIKTSW